jgi:hypothetical protein
VAHATVGVDRSTSLTSRNTRPNSLNAPSPTSTPPIELDLSLRALHGIPRPVVELKSPVHHNPATMSSGEVLKADKDFSKEADAAIPEAEKLGAVCLICSGAG